MRWKSVSPSTILDLKGDILDLQAEIRRIGDELAADPAAHPPTVLADMRVKLAEVVEAHDAARRQVFADDVIVNNLFAHRIPAVHGLEALWTSIVRASGGIRACIAWCHGRWSWHATISVTRSATAEPRQPIVTTAHAADQQ